MGLNLKYFIYLDNIFMNKPTLYYSARCPYSSQVLALIEKSQKTIDKFSENFNYTKVDGNRNLPSAIKSVPSMVVPEMGNRILTGDEVTMYIQTIITRQSQDRRPNQPNAPPAPTQNSLDPEGISAYLPSEMGGFGDSYSYIDGDDNLVQTHCYEYLDDNGNKQRKCEVVSKTPNMSSNMPSNMTQRPQSSSQSNFSSGMTASQHNTIRLQQQARQMGNGQMQVVQDPTRQPLQNRDVVSSDDYERFLEERRNQIPQNPPRV